MTDLGIPGLTKAVPFTSGGSSVIYEAWQEDFERRVAVKVLRGPVAERTQRRFQRERHAAGRLSGHPGILSVYAGGVTDGGELYLVMPFIDGGSLQNELNRGGRFSLKKAVTDVCAIAEAIEFAHRQGVIHRDIKPANILRDKSGGPLVADFGIARLLDAEVATATVTANTPLFAAPEVLSAGAATVSSDIYSLGALLYALLAGRPAFSSEDGDNIWTIMDRIRIEEPADIPGVPVQVMDVIRGAMAKTPINRPTSARLFAQYLRFAMHEARRNPRSDQVRPKHQLRLAGDQPLRPEQAPQYHPNYQRSAGRTFAAPSAAPAASAPRPSKSRHEAWFAPAVIAAAVVMLAGLAVWRVFPVFGNDAAAATEVATSQDASYAELEPETATATPPPPTTTPIPDPTATPAPTTRPLRYIIPDPTATPEPTFVGQRFDANVPEEWNTRKDNVDVGYGFRSEFRAASGSDFLIIDTTPKSRATPGVTIEQSARYVAGTISSASDVTYEKIGDKDAWWFSYRGNDGSQRIDIFFEVDGNGYAVVGGSYGDTEAAFEAARDFVRSLNNKQ